MSATYTPMIEQYLEIKNQHPKEILFFRLGDFYEMFFEDAQLASQELELTLTARDGGEGSKVPMCGVPYRAADNYIVKLINKGYKVAICDQVEDPNQVKGIVRREVVKIITPGTILSDVLLTEKNNNFLVLLYEEEDFISMAAADISTGECIWTVFQDNHKLSNLYDYIFRLVPTEVVIAGKLTFLTDLNKFVENRLPQCVLTPSIIGDYNEVKSLPGKHFPTNELPDNQTAFIAVGCLLYYLHQTLKCNISHINRLIKYNVSEFLIMDSTTLRNLEITRNIRDGGKKDTLLSILDFTKTAMGGRLLKRWLEYPLLNPIHINDRQDAVEELLKKSTICHELQARLSRIYDLERILARIEVGIANARDLVSLKNSLMVLPAIKSGLMVGTRLLGNIAIALKTHIDVVNIIDLVIVDNPPIAVRDGDMIKANYDLELDELRTISRDSKQWIQTIEKREKEVTGIKSLKIGYNKIFGYYIEIRNTNSSAVPTTYVRKQTLVNAERYITPELKEFETKVLGAQEKIVNIEYQLFCKVRDYIKESIMEIQETARQLAQLDVIASLSTAAQRNNYIRPKVNLNGEIIIKDGRHPVVEQLLKNERFVPNDIILNHKTNEIMIITGPNMAGKSTYMRQVAILSLMAQVGGFIPAREAQICIVDRIFTRIGASDYLTTGHSTFMVEMNEVSHILHNATANSLIILDEIGRGTSTFDGMSIARAVVEYIKNKIKAKTLFATHYHELTDLVKYSPCIKNYSIAVKERGNDIVFLRRIISGGADKSYGIHVAQLAGLPKKVLERAQDFLQELEQQNNNPRHIAPAHPQAIIGTLLESNLGEEIMDIDISTITPLEALNIIYRLQLKVKQEAGIL